MFEKAAAKHKIDFSRSYMVGDKVTDLKPAIELNITPFFIRSRHEPNQDKQWLRSNDISSFDDIGQVINSLAS